VSGCEGSYRIGRLSQLRHSQLTLKQLSSAAVNRSRAVSYLSSACLLTKSLLNTDAMNQLHFLTFLSGLASAIECATVQDRIAKRRRTEVHCRGSIAVRAKPDQRPGKQLTTNPLKQVFEYRFSGFEAILRAQICRHRDCLVKQRKARNGFTRQAAFRVRQYLADPSRRGSSCQK